MRDINAPFQNYNNFIEESSSIESSSIEESKLTKVYKTLPSLEEITMDKFMGPHPESNKVFDGLYAGAYPGDIVDEINDNNIIDILNKGVSTFVCMQAEYNNETISPDWSTGLSLRPYFKDVERIISNKSKYPKLNTTLEKVNFEHCPIRDLGTISDKITLELAKKIVTLISNGEIIYLHCWGGHGRTGIIVCLVLHLMYGLTSQEAIKYCETVHMMRQCAINVRSPQTYQQREQVIRIIDSL